MTQPRTRPPRRRTAAPPPARPDGCRCQSEPDQRWPVVHADHLGDATYRITRRHQAKCGRPAEPIDTATWRTR